MPVNSNVTKTGKPLVSARNAGRLLTALYFALGAVLHSAGRNFGTIATKLPVFVASAASLATVSRVAWSAQKNKSRRQNGTTRNERRRGGVTAAAGLPPVKCDARLVLKLQMPTPVVGTSNYATKSLLRTAVTNARCVLAASRTSWRSTTSMAAGTNTAARLVNSVCTLGSSRMDSRLAFV